MVSAGDALLAPSITRRLIDRFARPAAPVASSPRVSSLTAGSGSNREASSSQGGSSGSRTPACSPSWACAHAVVLAYELGVVRPGDR
jgi:hypothetical protein